MNSFLDKIGRKWSEGKFVCVGLDKGNFEFDKNIIDQTADLVCAYKLNSAFYEEAGTNGWSDLEKTITYIKEKYPDILIILDAKRGDIENTNSLYAKAVFDKLGADGVTVSPYLGQQSLQPFLERSDKGIFVIVKTSNPGAGEFQDLEVGGKPLYQVIAEHVVSWNSHNNLGVVVGATYPDQLKKVREIVGDMPILIPGVGAQGGNVKSTIQAGLNSHGQGIIISSSRDIIFSEDPRAATLKMHQEIEEVLKNV
ncbi:orotidine-5'-phosphate decarboxylase [Candidatus Daviesbacteria bacterium]|nr:orotidine-5'-phosphate decarboxylase [Candidatus Daviesbacteria bacterium]MBI4035441.1 orotidine-5'-phosphate decarboxylase [Candidatus Daviesbacteria bacterium]